MRMAVDPRGRRAPQQTVPLTTALALRDQAQSALEELERVEAENVQLRTALASSRTMLASSQEALEAEPEPEPEPASDGLEDAVLSLKADLANVRRHQQVALERARKDGQNLGMLALVDAVDDLVRAQKTVVDEAVLSGIRSVTHRMVNRVRSAGLELLGDVGEPFDPLLHEAVGMAAGPDGLLVEVHALGVRDEAGRLVRPAQVVVGQGGDA